MSQETGYIMANALQCATLVTVAGLPYWTFPELPGFTLAWVSGSPYWVPQQPGCTLTYIAGQPYWVVQQQPAYAPVTGPAAPTSGSPSSSSWMDQQPSYVAPAPAPITEAPISPRHEPATPPPAPPRRRRQAPQEAARPSRIEPEAPLAQHQTSRREQASPLKDARQSSRCKQEATSSTAARRPRPKELLQPLALFEKEQRLLAVGDLCDKMSRPTLDPTPTMTTTLPSQHDTIKSLLKVPGAPRTSPPKHARFDIMTTKLIDGGKPLQCHEWVDPGLKKSKSQKQLPATTTQRLAAGVLRCPANVPHACPRGGYCLSHLRSAAFPGIGGLFLFR